MLASVCSVGGVVATVAKGAANFTVVATGVVVGPGTASCWVADCWFVGDLTISIVSICSPSRSPCSPVIGTALVSPLSTSCSMCVTCS